MQVPSWASWFTSRFANSFRRTWFAQLEMFTGTTKQRHIDLELMPSIGLNEPGSTSIFNQIHGEELIRTGKMLRFNYENPEANFAKYG